MRHFTEEELIAYQMGESDAESSIRRHVDACPECRATAESIAATLRVFAAEPVPDGDVEEAWTKLRGNLSVLDAAREPQPWWHRMGWPVLGAGFAGLLLVLLLGGMHLTGARRTPLLLKEHALANHGPLTAEPADLAVAAHLDSAEMLLTEVNHEQGPLDTATREQAHTLLMKNAVYLQSARTHGDYAEASVLEDLGRVLTTLDHEAQAPRSTWRLRLEMNTDGLLLDIRILRQNDKQR